MPIINIELLKGRTVEQKREIAKEITESVSRIAKTPKENVKIIFRDMETYDFAQAGELTSDILEAKNEQK